jgi:hypothetical protein
MENKASRWKRNKNPGRLILQQRDREIITSIYSFRIITRQQLQELFSFNSARRVNQRLRKLYDHKYLSRYFLPTIRGSAKAVYYLGPRGTAIVADELGIDLNLVNLERKSTSNLKELFLCHVLGLNDIRIAFYLGLDTHPEMALERWINDNDCHQQYRVAVSGKSVIKQFRPDGYFRIIYKGKLYSFFIEYDRSTMTVGRFAGKVHSYLDFHALGYYRKRFGVQYFRVLVVTKTRERLYNLKKAVEVNTDKLFWFTTINQITSNTVFSPIWQRVGKQKFYPLIGL